MAFLEKIVNGLIDINPKENTDDGKPTFVLFQLKYPILTTNVVSKINTFLDYKKVQLIGEATTPPVDREYTYIPTHKQLNLNYCSIM